MSSPFVSSWIKWRLLALSVALFIATARPAHASHMVDFDDVVAQTFGQAFAGSTWASKGVNFTSVTIPDTVAIGDIITLTNIDSNVWLIPSDVAPSLENYANAIGVFSPDSNDVLLEFNSPVTSVSVVTDLTVEDPEVVRLIALTPTGNANEYQIVGITEGYDNAVHILSATLTVDANGQSFRYVVFQTINEAEGFDNVSATLASTTGVPEPASLAISGFVIGGLCWYRRRTSVAGNPTDSVR